MDVDFISINDDDDDLVQLPTNWNTLPRKSNLNFLQKDESSKQTLLPLMPWKDWNEFKYVYYNLFDHFYIRNGIHRSNHHIESIKYENKSLANLSQSYNVIEMWRSRGFNHLPICVDITQQTLHSLYLFNGNKECLRRLLAINITRATNRLIDKKHGKSTLEWSKEISFPIELISIRHDIVHEHLPSLYTLKQHSIYLLKWLSINYWQYQMNKINKLSDHQNKLLKFAERKNYIFIMKYFIPSFISQCLLDINTLNIEKVINYSDIFTSVFVKYNTFIQKLFQQHPYLIAHLIIALLQKRYKEMISKDKRSKTEEIKCNLMVLWSSSLLMDNDHNKLWKIFNEKQLIFVFENILKFVICFDDNWSDQIIKNVKKKAKQFHVEKDLITFKKMYIKPLKRDTKSDETMDNLVKDRLEAQIFYEKLISKKMETGKDDDEEDSDMDPMEDEDDELENKQKVEQQSVMQCKWSKTSECRFLPIGHSLLPPL